MTIWEDLVNRLVRKFRARVSLVELSIFVVVLFVAVAFAHGASLWYRSDGGDLTVVASVNSLGDSRYDLASEAGKKSGASDSGFVDAQALRAHSMTPGGMGIADAMIDVVRPQGNDTLKYMPLTTESLDSISESENVTVEPEKSGVRISPAVLDDAAAFEGGLPTNYGDDMSVAANIPNGIDSGAKAGVMSDLGSDAVDADPTTITTVMSVEHLYTVKVIADDVRHVFETPCMTVAALFEQKGIVMSKHDRLTGAFLDGTISSDLYIEITRIKSSIVTVDETIEAKVIYRENSKMNKGDTNVIREGADGLRRVEYEVLYKDGNEIGRNVVDSVTLKEPVSEIVEQGSTGSRMDISGNTFHYAKVIDVKCTAYNSDYESTGKRPGDKAYGITASGAKAKKGIVAVDPDIIPLGTRLYIDIVDESVDDYGYAVAGDTGGKIKGKKVDLYFEKSYDQLMQFGVHKAKVYILE